MIKNYLSHNFGETIMQPNYLNPNNIVVEIHDAFIDKLLFDDQNFDVDSIDDSDFPEIDLDCFDAF